MFERILTGSRYMVLIAVIGSLITAFALLWYAGLKVISIVFKVGREVSLDSVVDKGIILAFIQVIDLFILGTVFYIIAVGLYELFFNDRIGLPGWLVVHDFDDLKSKLMSALIVVLGVLFLGEAVSWKGGTDLLAFGASIALIIATVSYFLSFKSRKVKDVSKGADLEGS